MRRKDTIDKSAIRADNITGTVLENISKRKKGSIAGLPTGFTDLDRILSGLHMKNLIVVAGHPGIGTTAFALRIAEYLSIDKNIPVHYFSMELEKEKLIERILSGRANVNLRNVNKGTLDKKGMDALKTTASALTGKPLFFDDTNRLTFFELYSRIEQSIKEHKIHCVIVDYLQAMKTEDKIDLSETDYEKNAKGFKLLALKLNISILLLAHLGFDLIHDNEDYCEPRLADLEKALIIERYADVLMLVNRKNYYGFCPPDNDVAEILIKKNCNGSTGMIKLHFQKEYARYESFG